ncbi:MAG TPA: 1-deoxy-D-xylulose-5-phosphate reductoisomerase [Candidatus Acidoferrales bacterium]|nr:1-deoxy-D-xylulose-5-phosphate reductoisomerase [Candidatus Acidoferrales bacterium]
MKRIALLGSTGSIGRQCLDVVESLPERLSVVAMAAGSNLETLVAQIKAHRPELVSVSDADRASRLAADLRGAGVNPVPEIQYGSAGIRAVATHSGADTVVSAAVGVIGLEATYEAVRLGKQIALSNKEVLVAAGELVMAAAREKNVEILPVDSEHNAIHQCLRAGNRGEVRRLVLTASGGPFRKTPLAQVASASPEQALAHPNWKMGQRITIDSATLMNKGFEVIEARWLFGMPLEKIDVVVHPQSTIHSMVEYVDSSILAQLGPTDMRMPLQYALTYPERIEMRMLHLDWVRMRRLDFEKVSARRFPCLKLAREASRKGGVYPAALNAADEVAVAAFLERRMAFGGIPQVIESVLSRMPRSKPATIQDVLAADGEARRLAHEEIGKLQKAA